MTSVELPAEGVWATLGIFALVQLGGLISNLTHQRDLSKQQDEAIAALKDSAAEDKNELKGSIASVRGELAAQAQGMAGAAAEARRELREEIAEVSREIDALATEVRRELSGLREARAAVDAVKDRINADIEKLNTRTHDLRNSLNVVLRTNEEGRQSAQDLTDAIRRLQADLVQIGRKVNGG